MSQIRTDDQLPPATLHALGNVLERYGTGALLVFGLAFVVFLPQHPSQVLAGQLGVPAAAGFLYALLGEAMQYGAVRRLDDRGEVPTEWRRSDGTIQFFDRLAGELLRTPIFELLGLSEDSEVSSS